MATKPPSNTTTTFPPTDLELTYKNPNCSYDHWFDNYYDDIDGPKDKTPFLNCCTKDKPCGIDEGGCNSDEDCFGALTCGVENCAFRYVGSMGSYATDLTPNCCKVYLKRTTLNPHVYLYLH